MSQWWCCSSPPYVPNGRPSSFFCRRPIKSIRWRNWESLVRVRCASNTRGINCKVTRRKKERVLLVRGSKLFLFFLTTTTERRLRGPLAFQTNSGTTTAKQQHDKDETFTFFFHFHKTKVTFERAVICYLEVGKEPHHIVIVCLLLDFPSEDLKGSSTCIKIPLCIWHLFRIKNQPPWHHLLKSLFVENPSRHWT